MLDAIVDYLPSPVDIPPVVGINPRTEQQEERRAEDDAPLSALAFKIVSDPFVGRLAYVRVYSGTLSAGSYVQNVSRGHRERINRLLLMHANQREDVEAAYAGDIAAVVGFKQTTTGDTLAVASHPIVLENIRFPDPVISVAIEPRTKADQDKMSLALSRLAEEDPTFRVRTDTETGQCIISGMGELHLEVLVDRMLREYRVEAKVGRQQVAYRETITTGAQARGRFVRQSGGKGQFGDVELRVDPLGPAGGFEFVNKLQGGAIPKEFVPAIESGVKEALETGILGGYPVVGVRVTLLDGSFHPVDSSELAFKIAGSIAVKEALERSKPIVLEPVMKVEVVVPESSLGDVIGDLSSRRGHIQGVEAREPNQIVRASVPLAQMFGYATDVRSISQGRASYSMEFLKYQEVSDPAAAGIATYARF